MLDLVLSLATLAALTRLQLGLPWYLGALVLPVLVELVPGVVRTPVSAWRHRHAVAWELSTQSWGGWAVDRTKALAIGAVLTTLALAPLFFTAHWLPAAWPWLLAPAAALLVLVLGALAPIVLEPVFNRFEALPEGPLSVRLHETAARAGAPLAEILVADASRRTRGQNAYVSGLGRTRRLVLWDTLLASPHDEISVVLAHELGHRARRHVAVLTAAGMAGAACFVIGLRLALPQPVPDDAAAIALAATLLELAALPAISALSRRFERSADRFSLEVTRDPGAFTRLHRRLAVVNLAELEPPAWLYYWVMTHPTPPQRVSSV
ncbi:MAG TPA: M48 family metalloprotease [Gaiellaceae bacterium]|nr:M48 family metalloprotease [Gaiellaceae bacterium]